MTAWTEDEKNKLKTCYKIKPVKDLACELNKTPKQVYSQAERMGLSGAGVPEEDSIINVGIQRLLDKGIRVTLEKKIVDRAKG